MHPTERAPVDTVIGLDAFRDLSSLPEDFSPFLVAIRRHLHRHPELGLEEYQTSAYIRGILESHGLAVTGPYAGTGLAVDIEGEHPGPTIAYRADMDALPIQDAKEVSYASTVPHRAHLCGHDAHTTIAIGAALLLSRLKHLIHGTVRVFFQPNEEGIPSGAPLMIQDDVLEGVSAAFAVHVDPTLRVGTYGLKVGPVTASADRFLITIRSASTGHSARPHQGTDTIWVGAQIMNALYQLIGRVTDARNTAVITITKVRGGEAFNVIPSDFEFGGTIRCTVDDDREVVRSQMTSISKGIADAYGARVDVEFDHGAPPVNNDDELVDIARAAITARLGAESIFEIPVPSMGAEDFAHYLTDIPGVLLRVGTSSGTATSFPLHDSCFDIDELALEKTAALMASILISTLHSKAPALS